MKTFKSFLKEDSFKKIDIPKYFRVKITLRKKDVFNQLSKMELSGIKGISDQGNIIFGFYDPRGDNAFLMMKGQKVVDMNKLTRFMYTNPEYFVSNNFLFYKRLLNVKSVSEVWEVLYKNLLLKYYSDYYNFSDNSLIYNIITSKKKDTIFVKLMAVSQFHKMKVKGINDIVKIIKKSAKKAYKSDVFSTDEKDILYDISNIDNKKLYNFIYRSVLENVYNFIAEGEWDTKNDKLKIPKKSYLYILEKYSNREPVDTEEKKVKIREEEIRKMIKRYKLDKKYIIKYVDELEFIRVLNSRRNRL